MTSDAGPGGLPRAASDAANPVWNCMVRGTAGDVTVRGRLAAILRQAVSLIVGLRSTWRASALVDRQQGRSGP